jgi:hypothetical protein
VAEPSSGNASSSHASSSTTGRKAPDSTVTKAEQTRLLAINAIEKGRALLIDLGYKGTDTDRKEPSIQISYAELTRLLALGVADKDGNPGETEGSSSGKNSK